MLAPATIYLIATLSCCHRPDGTHVIAAQYLSSENGPFWLIFCPFLVITRFDTRPSNIRLRGQRDYYYLPIHQNDGPPSPEARSQPLLRTLPVATFNVLSGILDGGQRVVRLWLKNKLSDRPSSDNNELEGGAPLCHVIKCAGEQPATGEEKAVLVHMTKNL